MTEKLSSVGIVGTGVIAVNSHIPVLRASNFARIAWVADVDQDRARAVGRANGVPHLSLENRLREMPTCDVVLLAIPLEGRRNYFDWLERSEASVLAEKPLAVNLAEHKRLSSAFDLWRLAVGYQRRQYATSRLIREVVQSRTFGALREIRVNEGGRTTRTGGGGAYQDKSTAEGGGVTKNLGCHSLDLALWVTGAEGFRIVEHHVEWDGMTDRSATAVVRLESVTGIEGYDCDLCWTVSWLESQPNTLEFWFDSAALSCPVAPAESFDVINRSGRKIATLNARETGGATTSNQAFFLEWKDFLKGVQKRAECSLSARSCTQVAALMDELLD